MPKSRSSPRSRFSSRQVWGILGENLDFFALPAMLMIVPFGLFDRHGLGLGRLLGGVAIIDWQRNVLGLASM